MTPNIRVERLLRESVQTPYCDLVTRQTGRAVRTSIQQVLAASPAALALLDFSDVGLVDWSCADEIIAQLLLDPGTDTIIILRGLRDEQLEAIEHVLLHHRLAALVQDPVSGTARLVGPTSPDLQTAFGTLQQEGPATAGTLAARLQWPTARTLDALRQLTRLHLVQASEDLFIVPLAEEPLSP